MTIQSNNTSEAALKVIHKLHANGFVAMLAGGCVRDHILGVEPKDYDIVTDAEPKQVLALFRGSRKVGIKFGVVLVRRMGQDLEVATFRTDGPYSDGRHPDHIEFGTPEQDALRRDFTINGLFLDTTTDEIIDHVGGQADLRAGIIRTIGSAADRFSEDHLRMLRAVRFAARFDFEIEPSTLAEIEKQAHQLPLISPERIWIELSAILVHRNRRLGWDILTQTKLHHYLAKSWTQSKEKDEAALRRLDALPNKACSPTLAFATVLVSRPVKAIESISRELRLSNRDRSGTTWLVAQLPRVQDESSLELADLKERMASIHWAELMLLLKAELVATGMDLELYDRLIGRAKRIMPNEVAPPPFLTGADLEKMNLAPGPLYGQVLGKVYRAQLNSEIDSRKAAAALASKLIKQLGSDLT